MIVLKALSYHLGTPWFFCLFEVHTLEVSGKPEAMGKAFYGFDRHSFVWWLFHMLYFYELDLYFRYRDLTNYDTIL